MICHFEGIPDCIHDVCHLLGISQKVNLRDIKLKLLIEAVFFLVSYGKDNAVTGKLSYTVSGETKELTCDSVILSVGYKEEDSLYQELQFDIPEIYLLGDAKKVANIMYAIWDAFEVANHV